MLVQGVPEKYVFGLLLAVTLGMLALEKVNKAILVLLGSGLALLLAIWKGLLKQSDHGDSAHSLPVYIGMIDWGTIGIIIGSTIFVELISRGGLFTWVAVKILKVSRGDPFRLMICFSGLTVVFSAFLNNVTAMIIVGSLTIVSCRKLQLSAVPFLLTEGMVSEPTMIIAVTLFRNALNTTVNPEKQIIRRNGSPRDTFKIFTATHVNNPPREINSTKIVDPMIIPIVPQSIIPI
jgi:di/tricarboxylate transporter